MKHLFYFYLLLFLVSCQSGSSEDNTPDEPKDPKFIELKERITKIASHATIYDDVKWDWTSTEILNKFVNLGLNNLEQCKSFVDSVEQISSETVKNSEKYKKAQKFEESSKKRRSNNSSYYHRGPRGGCYTVKNGKKVYVDKSKCN